MALNDLFFCSLEDWVYCLYCIMRKQANEWIMYITPHPHPEVCTVWKTVIFLGEVQREYIGTFSDKPLINRFVSPKRVLHL